MPGRAWEIFVAKILEVGVNAAQSLIRIVLIVAVAYAAVRFLRVAMQRVEALLIRATESSEIIHGAAAKRIRTLTNVLWTISSGLLWFVVALIVLGQLGVNLGPILAGAGVVGLAVGFGAQHLVRDFVSGFFLLLENQLRVGDVAIVNGTSGLVESVSFRAVVLRDQAGVVHVFPNGSITTLANATKDWSAYVIDVAISYKEDPDRVITIMRQVSDGMMADGVLSGLILEPLEVFGVDNFTETAVVIKARFKTQAAQQYVVGREYRRRLKKALDTEGVELPPAAARPVMPKTAGPSVPTA
ncbi:MAG TPA: mechanosensitive ion channel domain-containing protein [Terriglobales bacterium]|nr:mechanosensitive ion channel domain-containing protein [Terriglobales bacterium]